MKFSYNWLCDYLQGKKPTAKELAELLTFHAFEIESVEKRAKDWLLDIAVLPNRAGDCLSFLGIAREAAVLSKAKFVLPKANIKEDKKLKSSQFVDVVVENPTDCPRYTAKIITDIKVGDSPKWLKERLEICGLQSINNIVDATNYVMWETGQPLHAFDFDKVKCVKIRNPKSEILNKSKIQNSNFQKKQIIVRRAKSDEKITTLDDKVIALDKDILVIADSKEPIAIAGIKGGKETGIDEKTKTIIIEAANFNQAITRKASQKIKIKTDASWRFENGLDINLIDFAQNRACRLIEELSGGKIAQGLTEKSIAKPKPKKIILDIAYVEKLLGIKIPLPEIKRILTALDFKLQITNYKLQVIVPTRRLDINLPEDLIEEIGRVYGYEKIPSIMPKADLTMPQRNDELFWQNNIKTTLKELGFCEIYGYSFIAEKDKEIFALSENELMELANPMSSFNKYLRPTLIINLLKIVKNNLNWFDQVKIFEIGQIFKQNQKPKEKTMLTACLAVKNGGDNGFFELKGMADILFSRLGISDIWYDDVDSTPEDSALTFWHPGKIAEIKTGDQEVGFLGQLNPVLTEGAGIKETVYCLDIDLAKLLKRAAEEKEYQEVSIHPASLRDLAVLVPEGTAMIEAQNVIESAGGELLRDVDLFDTYSGEAVEQGKENLAFHLVYQAPDRTLSSKEVEEIQQKIIKALEENPEWEVRK